MSTTPLWQLTATDLAALTTSGEVSCTEAVQSAVTRMQAVNPGLNAIVTDLSDEALARARALDAQKGPKGPLHGLPVTIKVNVDQTGHATTNGIPALAQNIAPDNAPLVQNLLDAGAVVIGRTNTPEFSLRVHTDNPLHGETKNPWGDHLSPGGSSGGAGSAVAAGMCALAHGNDIGGSLRYPAAAQGMVTVKPGLGRVPAWNPSQTAERGLFAQLTSVQGLICRSARDLHLGMPEMIRTDPRDPFHVPLAWRGGDAPRKVGVSHDMIDNELHPEVRAAMDAAAGALSDAGYEIVEFDAPYLREMHALGASLLMTELKILLEADFEAYGSKTLQQILNGYYDECQIYGMKDHLEAQAQRSYYARLLALQLVETPLLLTPFLPRPFYAPGRDAEGAEGVRECLFDASWCIPMNMLGLPAGNVPARLAEIDGKPSPVSVQVIGQRWREDLVVDAMMAIEERLGMLAPSLWARMG